MLFRIALTLGLIALSAGGCYSYADERPTMSSVMEAAGESDWRELDPEFTLYMKIPGGTVIMELAPDFAPNVIENIRLLTRARFFDGAAIIRSQENYVAQWGDPDADGSDARSRGDAASSIRAEFYRDAAGLAFAAIDSRDAYADQVGFVKGFPVGKDNGDGRAWLTHCYGMLGVGRDSAPDSGTGAELYVVTGHSPRHLDRNVVLAGRVVQGMELLTTLPRGTGSLGFYASEAEYVPIESIRFASDVAAADRIRLSILRTDTDTFQDLVEARRYRAEDWFVDPTDKIGLCNVPVPVRSAE
ncbi:MAG: peptidylprolyl isomerase [Gammaproteobacteria bacterium]|nr:MAG: peptidylprolyl isomerase [Gammaproteobacteria bacterium]